MLGEALEACFGVRLTIGPALEEGFYYDCYMEDRTLTDADKAALEKKIEQARLPCLFVWWAMAVFDPSLMATCIFLEKPRCGLL